MAAQTTKTTTRHPFCWPFSNDIFSGAKEKRWKRGRLGEKRKSEAASKLINVVFVPFFLYFAFLGWPNYFNYLLCFHFCHWIEFNAHCLAVPPGYPPSFIFSQFARHATPSSSSFGCLCSALIKRISSRCLWSVQSSEEEQGKRAVWSVKSAGKTENGLCI